MKWTVGIVNYKSAVYLPSQMRILHGFNEPCRVIILDNSHDDFSALTAEYPNIQIVRHKPVLARGSCQHGEGLTEILRMTTTPYLLVHDPDFFWVRKNMLGILESFLAGGCVAIGAQHDDTNIDGDPLFPSPYGCAYQTKALDGCDFHADPNVTTARNGRDVGWKIRHKLCGQPYATFHMGQWHGFPNFGRWSYEKIEKAFIYQDRPVAAHLMRGCFETLGEQGPDHPDDQPPTRWVDARRQYAVFFADEVARNG